MKQSTKKNSRISDKKRCFWLVFALLILSGWASAQTPELGVWTGLDVEKNISRSFSVRLNTQVRFADNISVARTYLLEPGLTYRLNKHWKVSGYYRYIRRLRWDAESRDYRYRPYSRFYANLSYDRRLGDFKLDYRFRYQNQFKDAADGSMTTDKSYLRNRLKLSYKNDSRFTPFASADLFYRIGERFDQIRYKAGTDLKINKYHSINLFMFTDQALGEQKTPRVILGAQYKLEF